MGKEGDWTNLLIGVYNHPEYYPPTLNAVVNLSKICDNLSMVYRPLKKNQWAWSENVKLIEGGKSYNTLEQKQLPSLSKILIFIAFTWAFLKEIIRLKPKIILVCDNYSLLSLRLCWLIIPKKTCLWYHNHDVTEPASLPSKLSIQYWAAFNEKRAFSLIDIFTVPTELRLKYFSLDTFKGLTGIIPNFPSKYVFEGNQPRKIDNKLKLVFMGSIAEGRGLEEIIDLLPFSLNGIEVEFEIFGFIGNPEFYSRLENLIEKKNVNDFVTLKGPVPYNKLITSCEKAHAGIGFYLSDSLMDQTISTASNKLFEYAAMGLPVFSNIEIPGNDWLIQTNIGQLKDALEYCIKNYEDLSLKALEQYKLTNNFENRFLPFQNEILKFCKEK